MRASVSSIQIDRMAKTARVPRKTKKKANKLILGGGLIKGTLPPKPTGQNNGGTASGTFSGTHT